jgi:hypothetical protein
MLLKLCSASPALLQLQSLIKTLYACYVEASRGRARCRMPLQGLAEPAGELLAAAIVLRVLWLLACACAVLCWPCCSCCRTWCHYRAWLSLLGSCWQQLLWCACCGCLLVLAWRPVLAMLQLLQDLVPLLGLAGPAGELFAAASVLRVAVAACLYLRGGLCWPCCSCCRTWCRC